MRASLRTALLLAGLVLAGPAWADWKRDYVRAERAAADGNWAEAEQLFRAAARSEPAPSERKRFEGVVFRDYAPQYWAGVAAWRQGACDRALDYWQDAANSAAVLSKIKDYKAQQDRGLAECRQTIAQTSTPPRPAPATTPAATPATAPPVTAPAVTTQPVAAPSVATPAPSATQPTRPPPVAQQPSAPPPATRPTTPASDLRPAPASLVTAVQAWIGGRYADVLAVAPDTVSDARARAHLHLLRAAARHSEAELGNAASLSAAQEEARAARRALATISPDASLFSPRFRAFWQQTR